MRRVPAVVRDQAPDWALFPGQSGRPEHRCSRSSCPLVESGAPHSLSNVAGDRTVRSGRSFRTSPSLVGRRPFKPSGYHRRHLPLRSGAILTIAEALRQSISTAFHSVIGEWLQVPGALPTNAGPIARTLPPAQPEIVPCKARLQPLYLSRFFNADLHSRQLGGLDIHPDNEICAFERVFLSETIVRPPRHRLSVDL
jgi:hypothetical protein